MEKENNKARVSLHVLGWTWGGSRHAGMSLTMLLQAAVWSCLFLLPVKIITCRSKPCLSLWSISCRKRQFQGTTWHEFDAIVKGRCIFYILISDWLSESCLTLNVSKTACMYFYIRKIGSQPDFTVKVKGFTFQISGNSYWFTTIL